MHGAGRIVTVVGVEQEAVGKHLDAGGEIGDLARVGRMVVDGEAQLQHLASGMLIDEFARRTVRDDPPSS